MLKRTVGYLGLTKTEFAIVHHILYGGEVGRWKMYKGTNVAETLGCILDIHPDWVKSVLRALVKRGWIHRGRTDVGDLYIQLTPAFVAAAELAYQRMLVRRTLGPVTWQKINGDDEIADRLHEMTLEMEHTKYRDRVKAAAGMYITSVKERHSSGEEVSLDRGGILPSQGRKLPLKLIIGERK
jgi:DNA-binding MarR family transcriptional regulator